MLGTIIQTLILIDKCKGTNKIGVSDFSLTP